jgi:hypothetical protein
MTKIRAEKEQANKESRKLLEECLESGGDLLMVAKSNKRIGALMSGDQEMLAHMLVYLTEKDPEFASLMLDAFKSIIPNFLRKYFGQEGVDKFGEFMLENFPPPPLPKEQAEC